LEPTDEVQILGKAIGRMAHRIKIQGRQRERAYVRTLHAERKLAEAERLATIGQFSAGLAHELNNPLAVILGAARMARESEGKKLKSWLDEIHREADRCTRLVSDLLNFARPMQLKVQRVDLAALAEETWRHIHKNPQEHLFKCEAKRFFASVDPDRFKQVLVNIFRNAVDAMPKGGEMRIEMGKKKDLAWLKVADQGNGVLKKDVPQLFRPFFSTKSSGTGLGLALSRAILQAHRGQIWFEPNKPRGVKICMEWPSAKS
jgi:signal transduction histidine kinase